MYTINNPQIVTTLNRLHQEAAGQGFTLLKGLAKGIFRKLKPEDMEEAYIPISRQQGEYLYDLLVQRDARHIVEFGTSFGVSTIYLGAAAQQTGGQVITTELLPSKCATAQHNFVEAGLDKVIDLREGDAMETLQDVSGGIDFLLLDGWNDLYLPLLQMLEPKLKPGALIYTDNAAFRSARPLLDYYRANPQQYRSKRIRDNKGGSELTEYLAPSLG